MNTIPDIKQANKIESLEWSAIVSAIVRWHLGRSSARGKGLEAGRRNHRESMQLTLRERGKESGPDQVGRWAGPHDQGPGRPGRPVTSLWL